jgi:hypothetical protein
MYNANVGMKSVLYYGHAYSAVLYFTYGILPGPDEQHEIKLHLYLSPTSYSIVYTSMYSWKHSKRYYYYVIIYVQFVM